MPEKPQVLRSQIVAQTRIFRVEQLNLRFPNGVEVCYERLRGSRGGAVLVVPMLDAETVLLIREYAAGVDRYELALPKGLIEPGEDPLAAANREIMEEIGHGARRIEPLRSMSLAPGYLDHTTHVLLARDLYPKRLPGDEPEEIEVVPWKLARFDALLAREDFTEARSIAALFLAREFLRRG